VLALELDGDRLAEGIVGKGVLDPAADRLDELEELLRLPFRFADDIDLGEDFVVAFAQLVEEHVDSRLGGRMGPEVYDSVRNRPFARR
jgi:hypothetical protein